VTTTPNNDTNAPRLSRSGDALRPPSVRVAPKRSRGSVVGDRQARRLAMMIDPSAKLLAVLDHAEDYRGLALLAKDRGEREIYERIVELYVEIAEELERLIDR
jgi:hypothetical protein